MSGIDRRALLGAAGASLVLAGCKKESHSIEHKTGLVGTCRLHGQSVRDKVPYIMGNVKFFAPDRLCIIYLKFDAGRMKARRTYIDITTSTNIPNTILTELIRVSAWGDPDPNKDRDDIHPIRLAGQRVVAIYVNNSENDIRFSYKRNVTPQQEDESYAHTIRFTQYSGEDPARMIRKNHAFFNVRKISLGTVSQPMEANTVFLLDYWNTNEIGNNIEVISGEEDTKYIYSMNIKLEMAVPMRTTGPQLWIPLIVDPDTGNGGSEP